MALAFCALFGLLLGRIWWFGEASTWAGFIRTCLFLCLILSLLSSEFLRGFLQNNHLFWFVAVFLFYIALSSALLGDGKTLRRVILVLAFFIAVAQIANQWSSIWNKLISTVGAFSALASILTLWTLWQAGLLNLGDRAAAISGSGIDGMAEFENSVLASLQMGFSLILIVWLFLTAKTQPARFFWFLCGLVTSVYVFGTLGRTGWLAAAIATVVLFTVLAGRRQQFYFWGGMLILVTIVIVFFHERVAYELLSRKLTHRDEIWGMVLGLMPGKWLLGYGADASVEDLLGVQRLGLHDAVINHAHSIYIEVIFNYGLVGLSGLIALLVGSIFRLWKHRENPLSALWLATLCGAAVSVGFDFSSFLSTPNLVWLWVWLPVAFACALPVRPQKIRPEV
jgi:O-antigen ligase